MIKDMSAGSSYLKYEGTCFLRQQILLSVLSGRPFKVFIPPSIEEESGLKPFEKDLVLFVTRLSRGASVKFNESSTELTFQPGILDGGLVEHECSFQRGIGYYLEVAICLAPFMKIPLDLKLKGVTNHFLDPSIDSIIYSTIPLLKKFITNDDGLKISLIKRATAPDAGGEVHFQCPIAKNLRPIKADLPGKVYRVRGISWTTRVSPAIIKRMTETVKTILGDTFPNMFIDSDHRIGSKCGKSPGFGITLVAETREGEMYCSDALSPPKSSTMEPKLPEDVGKEAAIRLLMEIQNSGCVNSDNQYIACTWMILNNKDISKMLLGELTNYTIHHLRHIKDFFGTTFKVDEIKETADRSTYLLTCIGIGYCNISKRFL